MLHGVQLALILLAGAGLGTCFFGGLAWTVRRWISGGSAMFVLGSFLLRSTFVVAGFWLLARNHADAWIACLLGFTAGRMILQKTIPLDYWSNHQERGHASHH